MKALPDWLRRLTEIGALTSDSEEERLRKSVLVLSSSLITTLAFAWVGTYAVLGLWLSAAIPFTYQLASAASIYTFARTRRYRLFRTSQLWMSLLLPFALQWSLGGFVESIEHLYQAADCFVFPVLAADGAIELPLSVLEAMATNLPIMTTRFGGLPELIDACPGLCYVDTPADLEKALADRRWMQETRTRDAMLPFSWPSVAAAVFREFEGLVRAAQHRPAEVA